MLTLIAYLKYIFHVPVFPLNDNNERKLLLTKRVEKIFNNKIKNKNITFLGVTFKPNTDDMREASSLFMIPRLHRKGAKIKYFDPSGIKNNFDKLKNVKFCNSISSACLKSDLIIIHTEWNEFKLINFKKFVKKNNFIVYDMRNIYSQEKMNKDKIRYFSIGR